MIAVRAELGGFLEACVAFGDNLDSELEASARTGAIILAEAAKRDHWYENRTQAAENNTLGIVPAGSFLADNLAFGAEIGTEYGEYLEARAPVLGQAWLVSEDEIAREFDAGLTRAVEGTPGWRSG